MISEEYSCAEREMAIPPVAERGRTNQNPPGIGFWALVAEDFRTHERRVFEQGFWAVFTNRFGNWRMGQPKLVRAPCTVLYMILFKLVEVLGGISLWYTVKLGRRVRLWHHSGMVIGARAIGDDVQIRQNTTIGVAQTGMNADLPIIGAGADIGAGACIAGSIHVGRNAKIGANALVVTDVPEGATVMGNPAQIVAMAREPARASQPASPPAAPARSGPPAPARAAERLAELPMLAQSLDLGRIALLGSANLDPLALTLVRAAGRFGLVIDPQVPDFGTARLALLQPRAASPLQQVMDVPLAATLIVERAEDVFGPVAMAPLSLAPGDAEAFLDTALQPLQDLIRDAREKLRGPVFVLRLAAFHRSSLGLADAGSPRGLGSLIAHANERLDRLAGELGDVHLLDTAAMLAAVGLQAAAPGEYWHMGRIPFGEAFGEHLSRRVLGALMAVRGRTARILVLDLDNTLWGGVLGEDGIAGVKLGGSHPGSAYKAFQSALRALTDRGIVLAIASKNDEDLAVEMITGHPEMALRLPDFVATRINWVEKAQNIQEMLDEIGLGTASCMFIDDNPVEREKVRKTLPDCIVPEFPEAPGELADWLLDNPFLETLQLTDSDIRRSAQYKVQASINAARRTVANVADFYRDLAMRLTFEPYGALNQQRVLQLFAKTNQFNATTRRHDARALQRILDAGGEVHAIGLQDRHSAYELMGVIVLCPDAALAAALPDDPAVQAGRHPGAWWVDSFLLSCRVLGRTVEQAILAWATRRAAERGAAALIGQIIETPRNTPVRGVFESCGFARLDGAGPGGTLWRHDLAVGPLALPDYFALDIAPPAPPPAPTPVARDAAASEAAPPAALAAGGDARLAALFRSLFRLEADADLSRASMDTVAQWDSLAHLKLAMEIERDLGVKLPGSVIGGIRSWAELNAAVTQRL